MKLSLLNQIDSETIPYYKLGNHTYFGLWVNSNPVYPTEVYFKLNESECLTWPHMDSDARSAKLLIHTNALVRPLSDNRVKEIMKANKWI